ncbi:MAG TPA: hypothetical protein VMT20_15215 [Terriglobia bacterium]|nr:hypothetical protein [Terriglobia bacterium]
MVELRPMVEADLPEAIALAQTKYKRQLPRLTYEGAREFCLRAFTSPEFLLIRGEDVFYCAGATRTFMEPEVTVGSLWIFSKKPNTREFLGVIRAAEDWAKALGAVEVGFGNISDRDFTRVARRLGYYSSSQYFTKRLRG